MEQDKSLSFATMKSVSKLLLIALFCSLSFFATEHETQKHFCFLFQPKNINRLKVSVKGHRVPNFLSFFKTKAIKEIPVPSIPDRKS